MDFDKLHFWSSLNLNFAGYPNIQIIQKEPNIQHHPTTRSNTTTFESLTPPSFSSHRRGYMFMDSPGNDLESTAGQTASGCNFIAFTTGNGAVTNHPLVPTAKIITTTRRYQLVGADMDFNAGTTLSLCTNARVLLLLC